MDDDQVGDEARVMIPDEARAYLDAHPAFKAKVEAEGRRLREERLGTGVYLARLQVRARAFGQQRERKLMRATPTPGMSHWEYVLYLRTVEYEHRLDDLERMWEACRRWAPFVGYGLVVVVLWPLWRNR